jgi:hypothetical protein
MLFPTSPVGFVGERKAIALLSLAFYVALYGLMALLAANNPDISPWSLCFTALFATYGVSFFALASEWFWARWFAIGLGYSGLTMAGWAIVMQRSLEPVLIFYGITHGLVALMLQGEKMAGAFDAKPGWRERLNLDETSVIKIRHTVTRAAAGLPTLIMFALAPRETALGVPLVLLVVTGLFGLLTLRTYGVLLLLGAGLTTLGVLLHTHAPSICAGTQTNFLHALGLTGATCLLFAVAPFAKPMARFLGGRL